MDSGYRGTLIGSGGNNAINPTNVEVKLFESYNGGKEIKTNDDIITFSTNATTNINAKLNVLNDVSINGLVNIAGSLKVNDVQLSSMGVNGNMNVSGVSLLQNVTVANKSTLRDVSVNGIMDVSGILTCKNTNVNGNLNVSGVSVLQDVSVNNLHINGTLSGVTLGSSGTSGPRLYTSYVGPDNGVINVNSTDTINYLNIGGLFFSQGVNLVNEQGFWIGNKSIISVIFKGLIHRTNILRLMSQIYISDNGVATKESIHQGVTRTSTTENAVYWSTNDCYFEIMNGNVLMLNTIQVFGTGTTSHFIGIIQLLVY